MLCRIKVRQRGRSTCAHKIKSRAAPLRVRAPACHLHGSRCSTSFHSCGATEQADHTLTTSCMRKSRKHRDAGRCGSHTDLSRDGGPGRPPGRKLCAPWGPRKSRLQPGTGSVMGTTESCCCGAFDPNARWIARTCPRG